MNTRPTINSPLFAQVEFSDNQTVLNVYGAMPAKKVESDCVNALAEIPDQVRHDDSGRRG